MIVTKNCVQEMKDLTHNTMPEEGAGENYTSG